MCWLRGYLICGVGILLAASCSTPVQEEKQSENPDYKESFVETNKYMRARHREQMIAFMDRVGWEMTETSTGLWYMILENGNGKSVERDKFIEYAEVHGRYYGTR